MVMAVFGSIHKNVIEANVATLATLINGFCKESKLEEASSFLMKMVEASFIPNRDDQRCLRPLSPLRLPTSGCRLLSPLRQLTTGYRRLCAAVSSELLVSFALPVSVPVGESLPSPPTGRTHLSFCQRYLATAVSSVLLTGRTHLPAYWRDSVTAIFSLPSCSLPNSVGIRFLYSIPLSFPLMVPDPLSFQILPPFGEVSIQIFIQILLIQGVDAAVRELDPSGMVA
ncbi:hypothetical protein ACLOJK_015473 [Asimina triloba]